MWTIVHTESSMGWGGQEIRILTELVHFTKRGYRVGLVCQSGSEVSQRARRFGIRTWELPFRRPFDLPTAWRIYRILKEEGVDLVNTHSSLDSWVASFAARMAKVPVIRTRHLSVPLRRNPLSRLVYSHLCDKIVTTGEAIRQRLLGELRLDPQKVVAIPTGVDLDRFDPKKVRGEGVRADLGLEASVPVVGMVAVLRSWKGHRIFLEAVPLIRRMIPQAKFLFVGDGPQRANIERWIRGMGLEGVVIMTGHREDIPEVLAALDVVVSASTTAEGVPQALLQALAMERPVVATGAGGVSEIIRDGETGLLIPPRDPQALAEAVMALLNEPSRASAMASAGRRLVEKDYPLEVMLQKLEALYRDLLKR